MKLAMVMCAVMLVGSMALLTEEPPSPDPSSQRRAQAGDAGPDTESQVETWVRCAMPGEHHKLLEKMAGPWSMAIKYRMKPETPVVESHGTCDRKWILGNRFLLEEFDGGALALPFQGLAIYGYDSFEKKYTSVWLDTMSTAITTNLGTCRNGCDEISFVGRHGDPWTGTMKPSRGITRFIDEKRHLLELYEPDANGVEFKILEIVYTRK